MCPFLKEFVKPEWFPSVLLRTDSVLRFRLFVSAVGCKGFRWTLLLGFGTVVVAAGDCNRSCHARLPPNLSFASHHSRLARAALPSCGRRGYIWCDSSPKGPLHTVRRAIDWSLSQATTSRDTFELAQTGGISSCTSNSDRTTCAESWYVRSPALWFMYVYGRLRRPVIRRGSPPAKRMAPADDRT